MIELEPDEHEALVEMIEEMAGDETSLNLQLFCDRGYPDIYDTLEVFDLKVSSREGDKVTGSFKVLFTEEAATGCRDIQFHEKIKAGFDFTADLDRVEIETTPIFSERQLDREDPEF